MKKNSQNLNLDSKNSTFYFLFSKFSAVFLLSVFYFLFSESVFAAELRFNTSQQLVAVNETLVVEVLLDAEDEELNAIEGQVQAPENFSIEAINDGSSLVTLWLEKPQPQGQKISFAGVMPGGYRERKGLLFSVILRGTKEGNGAWSATALNALLNDGHGTPTTITSLSLPLTVRGNKQVPSQTAIKQDLESPESFTIHLEKNDNIFNGQWFLVFATQDKESGIDHYEVQEGNDPFSKAQSPYLLHYQKLNKSITVKAVDRQGNERIVKLAAPHGGSWYDKIWYLVIIIGAVLVLILISRRGKIKPNYGGKNQINTS